MPWTLALRIIAKLPTMRSTFRKLAVPQILAWSPSNNLQISKFNKRNFNNNHSTQILQIKKMMILMLLCNLQNHKLTLILPSK